MLCLCQGRFPCVGEAWIRSPPPAATGTAQRRLREGSALAAGHEKRFLGTVLCGVTQTDGDQAELKSHSLIFAASLGIISAGHWGAPNLAAPRLREADLGSAKSVVTVPWPWQCLCQCCPGLAALPWQGGIPCVWLPAAAVLGSS